MQMNAYLLNGWIMWTVGAGPVNAAGNMAGIIEVRIF